VWIRESMNFSRVHVLHGHRANLSNQSMMYPVPHANSSDRGKGHDAIESARTHTEHICRRLPPHMKVKKVLDYGNGSSKSWVHNGTFEIGSLLEVGCVSGFEGSSSEWKIECADNGTWVNGSTKPECIPVLCNDDVPTDPVGAWQGLLHYKGTLHLHCTEGYVPDGGTPVLHCLENGAWEPPLARCVPGKGRAEVWRRSLRSSALLSLLVVITLAVVAVALCWREPVRSIQHISDGSRNDGRDVVGDDME